ncbi:MAG: hypothetical protein IT531_00515 [Burkholderiales bacterium]|nr:hypothetical protein [Burkholderiales bacterium]
MTDALTKALVERERLLAQIAAQRSGIASAFAGLSRPAAIVDRVLDAGRFLRAHPAALGALVAAVFALRGRAMFGLAVRGLSLWRVVRRLRTLARLIGR